MFTFQHGGNILLLAKLTMTMERKTETMMLQWLITLEYGRGILQREN
jgi:hypothetical protein